MIKVLISLSLALLAGVAEARVRFYPTASRVAENQLADDWRPPGTNNAWALDVKYAKGRGGPFAENAETRRVWCERQQPGYWRKTVKVKPGRTYLSGTWAKMAPSKLLLNHTAKNGQTGKYLQERLYYFCGFNQQLLPYFSEETRRMITGDPERWRLFYRTMTFPQGTFKDRLEVSFGLYINAGDITFADSFFVDVTDLPHTMEVVIDGEKPIKRLVVKYMGLRDTLWEKKFNPVVTDFSCTLPPEVDAFRDGSNAPRGHALVIYYADGTQYTVYAPEQGCFVSR